MQSIKSFTIGLYMAKLWNILLTGIFTYNTSIKTDNMVYPSLMLAIVSE